LLFYAGQLARRADRRLPVFRNGRAAPPFEQVDNVLTAAHVLSAQLRELGTARAWHPSGLADATGWAGVAVTEVVVHGSDVASALHLELPIPAEACSSTWAAAAGSHRPRRGAWGTRRPGMVVAVGTAVAMGRRGSTKDPLRRTGSKGHDRRTDRAELLTWRTCLSIR